MPNLCLFYLAGLHIGLYDNDDCDGVMGEGEVEAAIPAAAAAAAAELPRHPAEAPAAAAARECAADDKPP